MFLWIFNRKKKLAKQVIIFVQKFIEVKLKKQLSLSKFMLIHNKKILFIKQTKLQKWAE